MNSVKKAIISISIILLIITGFYLITPVSAQDTGVVTTKKVEESPLSKKPEEQIKMSPQLAWAIVNQASAAFVGTRQDHIKIQQALLVLKQLVDEAELKLDEEKKE